MENQADDKFKRHMSLPVEKEIETNGVVDKFLFRRLEGIHAVKYLKLAMKLSDEDAEKIKQGMSEEELKSKSEGMIKKLVGSDALEDASELVDEMLRISFPEKSKEDLSSFRAGHLFDLIFIMLEINMPSLRKVNKDDFDKIQDELSKTE